MPTAPDPELDRARRPIGPAFQRLRDAHTDPDFEDELTSLLHHFYRFSELCWKRLDYPDPGSFYRWLHSSNNPDLRAAGAVTWARNFDTHQLVVMSTPIGTYSDVYTDVYGEPCWKQRPLFTDKYDRHDDYRDLLEGRSIRSTLLGAYNALNALLP
jgi:hypothetical protein